MTRMITAAFTAMLIIIISVIGYNVGNMFMVPLYNEALGSGAPYWLIETIWYAWHHWIYLMFAAALLLVFLASQFRQSQEYEYA